MQFKISFISVLIISLCCFNVFAYDHPGGMHPAKQIALVKKQIADKSQPVFDAYKQLLVKADTAAIHQHHAEME